MCKNKNDHHKNSKQTIFRNELIGKNVLQLFSCENMYISLFYIADVQFLRCLRSDSFATLIFFLHNIYVFIHNLLNLFSVISTQMT